MAVTMRRLVRSAALAAIACAIAWPAAAQIPSTDIGGGGISRRGRYVVSGTVREADGERPLESVEVVLRTLSTGNAASTFTNSNGNFAFSDVPAGTYYLVVEEEGYEPVQEEVNFTNRPPIAIQLSLKRAATYTGPKIGSGPTVSAREFSIPRRAREAMERGLTLMNQKADFKGGVEQFQRAVREYPQYYEAFMHMGIAYMKMGDAAKSEQALRTSIDVSQRKYVDALFSLAAVYSSEKRFSEAEALAREAVKVDPDSSKAHQELARALHGLDQSAAAEAGALEAARIQADDPQTYLLLANIHLKMRSYPALIRDLDTYLQLSPNGPEADQARRMREQIFEHMANIQPRN